MDPVLLNPPEKALLAASCLKMGLRMGVAFEPAHHLLPETLEAVSENLKQMLCSPAGVARAVLSAVMQSITVNIADIIVRPPRAMLPPNYYL